MLVKKRSALVTKYPPQKKLNKENCFQRQEFGCVFVLFLTIGGRSTVANM
jgi:hypothetical protein